MLVAALVLVLAWWAARGIPVRLSEASTGSSKLAIPCVSYSPFRHPEINPFNYSASVTPAQIETDLRLLQSVTNCVRTYGLAQGLDQVPAVARQLGMRVKQGIWLSQNAAQNQADLARGLALAQTHKDVIDLLIVGNEVLLRRELTPAQLAEILRSAKARSPVPISYADVWEFWQRNDALAEHVDVVTIHVLPYWEDNPVTLRDAVAHLRDTAVRMQQHFSPTPVWVGETGWPAQGRQRAGAVPSVLGQNQYIQSLLAAGSQIPTGFNLIEAFDQPWKRSFEGAMGGYWGLFDQFGQARVSAQTIQIEDHRWWRGLLGGLLGLFGGAGLVWVIRKKVETSHMSNSGSSDFAALICTALIGALVPLQWQASVLWDRTVFEVSVSLALAIVGALTGVLSVMQMRASEGGHWASKTITLRYKLRVPSLAQLAHAARMATLFAAGSAALILLLDPRYRPLPWWWFLAPTAAWWALFWSRPLQLPLPDARAKILASVLGICAVGILWQEGLRNAQAIGYVALLACLALAPLAPLLKRAVGAKTNAANNAAGALSSAE
jgi:exo-beta-1,3-glucanase (GH17 family)